MTFADDASCSAGAGAGGFGDRPQQAARPRCRQGDGDAATVASRRSARLPAANLDIFNLGTIFAYQKEFS